MYADHPNHNGFTPQEHALAADYHHRAAKASTGNYREALFHFAQRDLHNLAAKGKRTKIGHVPSEAFLNTLPPEKQGFWRQQAQDQQALNSQLKALEPYRMGKTLSNNATEAKPTTEKIANVFGSVKSLAKSRTTDMQLAKRVEMDRQPPPPPLVAKETDHSQAPEYKSLLNTVLARRKAERNNQGIPVRILDNQADPRDMISKEQLEAIRQKVADRNRGGGW